jgi:hypothetical protein
VSLDLLETVGAGAGASGWGAGAVREAEEARGRAGDDLGSSRSSRDDDVPPEMYDEGVPHASEEVDPHASEEGAGGLTSSAASMPYK